MQWGPSGKTWAFQWRRWWHQFWNIVYMDDQTPCLLCQRPLLQAPSPLWSTHQFKEAHTVRGVCPFCLQDVISTDSPYRRRHVVVRRRNEAGDVISHKVLIISAQAYTGIARNAIRQWKYDGAVDLTPWFVDWLSDAYLSYLADAALAADTALRPSAPTAVVPVPTSPDRLKKRGYHHTLLLANAFTERFHWPVREWLQRRPEQNVSFTQSQTAKSARERLRSLQGAYLAQRPAAVQGQRVLLVDDIVTTGSTLATCAAALLDAGAAEVTCLVIADVE